MIKSNGLSMVYIDYGLRNPLVDQNAMLHNYQNFLWYWFCAIDFVPADSEVTF